MVRAGSLLYALCIALILSVLSSALILLAFNVRTLVDKDFVYQKQLRNVSSALNYYLVSSTAWGKTPQSIDLFHKGSDIVDISAKQWGFFEVVTCKAHQENVYNKAAFMVGGRPPKEPVALFLADQNKPLALCGRTVIKGKSYLPVQGVKRAYIEGQNFMGSKLIEGVVTNSQPTIPELAMKGDMQSFISNHLSADDSSININELEANKVVTNSFSNKPIVLVAEGNLDLDNYTLDGNIIIHCKGHADIKSSSNLTDIIILCKSITIEKGFFGNIQAFAEDSIILREDAYLHYPSSLCLLQTSSNTGGRKIVMHRGSRLKGNVVNYNSSDLQKRNVNVRIEESATITGLVYTKGYIDFKGQIIGSLYCGGFILRTPSAVYENHVLNAVIDASTLPDYFLGTFPSPARAQKGMIKRML